MPTIAFIILILSLCVQIVFLFRRVKTADRFTHYLLLIAVLLLFATTIRRSLKIEFIALTNTFESLVFFSGMIALILFVYRAKSKQKAISFVVFGGTVVSIVLLAVASSPALPKDALPPIPALRSGWLVLHVAFSFIGEAFFASHL